MYVTDQSTNSNNAVRDNFYNVSRKLVVKIPTSKEKVVVRRFIPEVNPKLKYTIDIQICHYQQDQNKCTKVMFCIELNLFLIVTIQ